MNATPNPNLNNLLGENAERVIGRDWLVVDASGRAYVGTAIAAAADPPRITLQNSLEVIQPADRVFAWMRVARHGFPVDGNSSVATIVGRGNIEIANPTDMMEASERAMQHFQEFA
jgi:hypothetical protein